MPTGREVLEVFQDAGVHPKAADDLHGASARTVACHSDRGRPSVGDEMFKSVACHCDRYPSVVSTEMPKSARDPHPYQYWRRQQRQNGQENDAAPGEEPKRYHNEAGAHRLTFIDGDGFGNAVLGIWSAIVVDEARERS